MPERTRPDIWQAGEHYDLFMGRWSRALAPEFIEWLNPLPGCEWLDVGCGTGALTQGLLARAVPSTIVAVDPSKDFLALARQRIPDDRVSFRPGHAEALPVASASCDAVGSGLALNFVADPAKALAEMRRAARAGGLVCFYVWDYPGGGVQFLQAFWQAAQALDPAAAALAEDRRFAFCTQAGLRALAEAAGLASVACDAITVPTLFRDFDDLWHPFTLGAGPAPAYCAGLSLAARNRLRDTLWDSLPIAADGRIALEARAWAVQGISA